MKKYTPIRRLYAWVGFLAILLGVIGFLAGIVIPNVSVYVQPAAVDSD
jgi:hypothetical protein